MKNVILILSLSASMAGIAQANGGVICESYDPESAVYQVSVSGTSPVASVYYNAKPVATLPCQYSSKKPAQIWCSLNTAAQAERGVVVEALVSNGSIKQVKIFKKTASGLRYVIGLPCE